MKNNWKIAFWICLLLFVITSILGLYSVIDQGVTLTYMKEGYADTKADLESMSKIVQYTHPSKEEIETILENHRLYEFMNFESDTIALERILLIFDKDSLKKIEKQW